MKRILIALTALLLFSCSNPLGFEADQVPIEQNLVIDDARAFSSGRIEAESYTAMSGVQTEACVEGGLNVGWIDLGDWMDYRVTIPSSGTYTINFRVASPNTTGKLEVRSGSTILATRTIPNTGGWQTWSTVTVAAQLSAGTQTLRLRASGPSFNLNWFEIIQDSSFGLGKIEAEQYMAMSGIQTEASSEGTLNVGWIDVGDWMDYRISIPTSTSYTIKYRVASPLTTGSIQLRLGSTTLLTTAIPNTGGWQNWTTVQANVQLSAGIQTLRLYASGAGFNINWFELTQGTTNPPVSGVSVSGRQILLNGTPVFIKGVCWNPIGVGGTHPSNLNYSGYVDQDAALMQQAGINVVRTYEPLTNKTVLDKLFAKGIYVINTVYSYGLNDPSSVTALVNQVKDHPAILMWAVGNEWNYNGIYAGLSHTDSMNKLNQAAQFIKAADSKHPVTTIYGHIPDKSVIDSMLAVDVWGLNVYSGLSFGTIFSDWKNRSTKPMYMAEYGADAWNTTQNKVDLVAQADATRVLTQLLISNSAVANASNVCSGGTIFEWADEWWKDTDPWVQNSGGAAPGGGPHPDGVFNEEYWGIVDIYRNTRPAYLELKKLFVP